MSIIRAIILTILFTLLTTLSSQPTRAVVPNVLEQFSCTNVTQIPQIECDALMALYNETGGPKWRDKTGWLVTNTPCSNWYGVTCGGGHITELDLSGEEYVNRFGLQGDLPAEISNLNNLNTLILSSNQLTSVPTEIWNLNNLHTLYLNSNQLSSLPTEIGNLSSHLSRLYLFENQLSSIPTEIGNLTNLTELHLGYNQLSSIPIEIGNLTNLYRLHLYGNQLNSLPADIWNLNNLTELSLSENTLNSIPAEIGNLTNLTSLWLSSNQLTSLPIEIWNLNKLTSLLLNNNQLSSLPAEIGNLNKLIELWLSDNQLSSIPAEIGNLNNLTQLLLSDNQLTNLPAEIGNLNKLTELWLDKNQLASLPPSFTNLVNLNTLLISDNHLLDVSNELRTFLDSQDSRWSDSQTFDCIAVTEIPQIECEALVALYNETDGPNWDDTTGWLATHTPCRWYGVTCDAGHITRLILSGRSSSDYFGLQGNLPAEIDNLSNLTDLVLSFNQLSSLPVEIGNLNNLIRLSLTENSLNNLPTEIGNLNNLTTLELEINQLSSLPAEIGALGNLTHLSLSSNFLSSLPAEIGSLNNLTYLDLVDNQLNNLPVEFWNLNNLNSLYFDHNQLSNLSSEIGNLNSLVDLSLRHNKLISLPSSIGNLTNLNGLELTSNQFSSLPAEIGKLNNLEGLGLSSNLLSNLPTEMSNLTSLTLLSLAYNRLVIPDNVLHAFLNQNDPDWAETQTIAPTKISANSTGSASIQLTWTPVAFQDKGGYYEISIADGDTYIVHGTVSSKSASSYIIDGLSSSTTYKTRIRTYTPTHNGDTMMGVHQTNELWSDYSEIVSATTLDQPTLMPTSIPTNTDTPTSTSTNISVPMDTPTDTPTPTLIPTNTPQPTNISTHTSLPPTITHTPNPVQPTPTQQPDGSDDSDDDCNQATQIAPKEILPEGVFETPLDIDWYTFQATAGNSYRITVDIPSGSNADVNLELYSGCGPGPSANWSESFAPGVQLDFTPPNSGPLYLRLINADDSVGGSDWRYQLSIRQLNQESETGAVIIVAGRLRLHDGLQDNIYAVTDRVFTVFREQGYTADDIYYLAPEADEVVHHDATATVDNVGWAITNWAAERLQDEDIPDVLTLYMMDHGGIDEFYLDGPRDEILRPTELDGWLDTLEQKVPGMLINVIIEACHAGSFIREPGSIIGPNRVIVTSSDQENDAYASRRGATFSDQFLTSLQRGDNLLSSWSKAKDVVTDVHTFRPQRPWINGDGDDIHNELEDFVAASERGFAYLGTLSDPNEPSTLWPPYIAHVLEPDQQGENGVAISAEVRDDRGVGHVWAVIYPPAYVPPTRDNEDELFDGEDENLERILLDPKGDDIYRGRGYNFTEAGTYRIVIHSDDADGLIARPVVLEYNLSEVLGTEVKKWVYLPLISR